MKLTFLSAMLSATFAVGCNLPPPTTVKVDPTNSRGTPSFPPLAPDAQSVDPGQMKDKLTPICDVRSGKLVNDDKKLAKAVAGVGEWQKLNAKAPPKAPEPVDPNQGPVSVTGKGVAVKIPGLESKKHTDQDPDWFAVSCADNKITATLNEEVIDLDALYSRESNASPDLWLAGYSLKTKRVILTKVSTKPRAKNTVPNTSFFVYDLTRYLTAKVEAVEVLNGNGGFALFFLDEGKKGGLRMLSAQYGDSVSVGRFTLGAPAK
jgi:hypothetical protein